MEELRVKVALLYKTKEEWDNDPSYVPAKGEICYCQFPNGNAIPKVGNGKDTFEDLNWLKADNAELVLYFGATYDAPTNLSGLTKIPGMTKQNLLDQDKKIVQKIDVTIHPELEIGQYPVIAVDKRFKLVAWKQAALPDFPSNSYITVTKDGYNLYYLSSRVTRSIEYLFIFELGD